MGASSGKEKEVSFLPTLTIKGGLYDAVNEFEKKADLVVAENIRTSALAFIRATVIFMRPKFTYNSASA